VGAPRGGVSTRPPSQAPPAPGKPRRQEAARANAPARPRPMCTRHRILSVSSSKEARRAAHRRDGQRQRSMTVRMCTAMPAQGAAGTTAPAHCAIGGVDYPAPQRSQPLCRIEWRKRLAAGRTRGRSGARREQAPPAAWRAGRCCHKQEAKRRHARSAADAVGSGARRGVGQSAGVGVNDHRAKGVQLPAQAATATSLAAAAWTPRPSRWPWALRPQRATGAGRQAGGARSAVGGACAHTRQRGSSSLLLSQ
jgi:hypothetical protein